MRESVIVGAGPGGTGPLVWAAQNGKLEEWLNGGVALCDRGSAIGGTLGRYIINSDSLGAVYLECLDAPAARDLLGPLRHEAVTREMERIRDGLPPLPLVGRFLHLLGERLRMAITASPDSAFLPHLDVRALRLREDGSVAAEAVARDGSKVVIQARTAIMALGGRQVPYMSAPLQGGVRLTEFDPEKIIPSDSLLTAAGLGRALALLDRSGNHRVAILGGSHSAFSAAWILTHLMPEIGFAPGEIEILLRCQPPIYYLSREEAEADHYPVTDRDICPRTNRVNRFGGVRGDGREIWRSASRRPGARTEGRVAMVPMTDQGLSTAALRRRLAEAALIVPAFGYRSATVPVFDAMGRRLALAADRGEAAVDRKARLCLANGGKVPNIFAIGLGADFRPTVEIGGEPSFSGQLNSLWLYQNDLGGIVYRGIREYIDRTREGQKDEAALPRSVSADAGERLSVARSG